MRNILARHSAMAIALAIVVAMPFAAAAADLFWYGTAGDGLWNTPANWSTTEGSYTASAAYPNDEMTYIVHLYTHLVAGHAIDITIPANCTDAACRRPCGENRRQSFRPRHFRAIILEDDYEKNVCSCCDSNLRNVRECRVYY